MGRKVFVSYKYHDAKVAGLQCVKGTTKGRDFVDVLETMIGKSNIYKGEQDGEDLSRLKDDTIWEKLKARIYDSSVTIVLITKGMIEPNSYDKSQWIPWEVRYSLCEYSKDQRTSHTNGLIGLVIPDENNSYDWFISYPGCCTPSCRQFSTNKLFHIMAKNLFNKKKNNERQCDKGDVVYNRDDSYMIIVKWEDFVKSQASMNSYIEDAYNRSLRKDEYDLCLEINRT